MSAWCHFAPEKGYHSQALPRGASARLPAPLQALVSLVGGPAEEHALECIETFSEAISALSYAAYLHTYTYLYDCETIIRNYNCRAVRMNVYNTLYIYVHKLQLNTLTKAHLLQFSKRRCSQDKQPIFTGKADILLLLNQGHVTPGLPLAC